MHVILVKVGEIHLKGHIERYKTRQFPVCES